MTETLLQVLLSRQKLIGDKVVSEDIAFNIGSRADGQNNAVSAEGQKIAFPAGKFNKLYILAAATEDTGVP